MGETDVSVKIEEEVLQFYFLFLNYYFLIKFIKVTMVNKIV